MPTSIVRLRTGRPVVEVNNGKLLPGEPWALVRVDEEWRVYVRKGQSAAARSAALRAAFERLEALPPPSVPKIA